MKDYDYLIIESLIGQALDQPENYDAVDNVIDDYVAADVYIDSDELYDSDDLNDALVSMGINQSVIKKVYFN